MSFIRDLWAWAKVGSSIRFGPITLQARLRRTPSLSPQELVPGKPSRSATDEDASDTAPAESQAALIVGCGEGLGSALARRFSAANMHIIMARRQPELLKPLTAELTETDPGACAVRCDATDYRSVAKMFRTSQQQFGDPDLVVYNIEDFSGGDIMDISPDAFEDCWRANCLGGFFVAREAAKRMVIRGSGTIIFSGATASLRGRGGYTNMAVGKFGLRALAQCLARELGPRGIHVAHVVIDGDLSSIGTEAVAENYLRIHEQPRSAWTHEMDLRRHDEIW